MHGKGRALHLNIYQELELALIHHYIVVFQELNLYYISLYCPRCLFVGAHALTR